MTENPSESTANVDDMEREPVEALAEEFVERHRSGERPTIEEYAEKYPQWADEIRDLFPTIAAMERLKIDKVASPPTPTVPVERLGDFQLVREIGRGGMGIVYEATQQSLGRSVALKVLANQLLNDQKNLKRFEREAQTAARLHHTNIVPVFGIGEQDGVHYYVMQLIDGVGLNTVIDVLQAGGKDIDANAAPAGYSESAVLAAQALCRGNMRFAKSKDTVALRGAFKDSKNGITAVNLDNSVETEVFSESAIHSNRFAKSKMAELPRPSAIPLNQRYWRSVARLGVQLADALHYAHQQGTMHRDIKPANLLLDREGIVWITDFGLAKAVEDSGVTRTGDLVGTPQYMAPEQFDGQQNELTDQYSLGLSLYEMLALQPAFFDVQRAGLIQKITEGRPASLRSLQRRVPRDLETIVLKAMARDPADRYHTAGDLRDDLQRFLDDRPIQARKATLPARLWRWCRRNRAVASLLGAAFALALLVAVVASVGYVRTNDALHREAKERKRAEDTLGLGLAALDEVFNQLAPERVVAASELTIEWKDGEQVNVTVNPMLSPETASLLDKMLVFYDKLAAKGNNNEKLRLQAAKANRRVGDIRFRFGDLEKAKSAYQTALAAYQGILKDSGEADLHTEIARIHIALGQVHAKSHQSTSASEAYVSAVEVLQGALSSGDDSQEVRYELAKAYYHMGRKKPVAKAPVRKKAGKTAFIEPPKQPTAPRPEEKSLQKAIAQLQKLVDEHPKAPAYRYSLALCHREMAAHQWFRQTSENKSLNTAIDILKELVADYGDVPDYQFALSETLAFGDVGYSRFSKLRNEADEKRLKEAMRIATKLAAQHPNVPDYVISKAQIHYKLGRIQSNSRQPGAEQHFANAVELQDRLIARFPNAIQYQAVQVRYVSSLIDQWNRQKKRQQSKEKLEELIGGLENELKKGSTDKMIHYPLFVYYNSLAKTLIGMRQFEASRQAGKKAKEHLRASPKWRFGGLQLISR